MDARQSLHQAILSQWPLDEWRESKIVIASSGGPDSTALLELLWELRPDQERTMVAHFNHGLRGAESDADQAFVEAHAARLGIACLTGRAEPALEGTQVSENSLRGIRHTFLAKVAKERQASWVALAHHADDQVETFVHHLLRGAGPGGLKGIPPRRRIADGLVAVRPLLDVPRSSIIEYLETKNVSYCIDRSNLANDYTRNRIRNELLPELRRFAGSESLDRRLTQSCKLIAEEHQVVVMLAERWLAGLDAKMRTDSGENRESVEAPISDFVETPWPIVRHALTMVWHRQGWPLREMNYSHWTRLHRFLIAASESRHPMRNELPGKIMVRYRKGILQILIT
jgi:tRNA(Ile)-lysidine synthase